MHQKVQRTKISFYSHLNTSSKKYLVNIALGIFISHFKRYFATLYLINTYKLLPQV